MRLSTWVAPFFLGLAGCGLPDRADLAASVVGTGAEYRETSVPIASTTRFDLARFVGDWDVTHAFADEAVPRAQFLFEDLGGAVGITLVALSPDGGSVLATIAEQATVVGPGRLRTDGLVVTVRPGASSERRRGPVREYWVLWVDADYRTAAIGTPDGRFGYVLDRDGAVSPDRLAAAREIFEWQGYDLDRLRGR